MFEELLNVDFQRGIDNTTVEDRRVQYGTGETTERKAQSKLTF